MKVNLKCYRAMEKTTKRPRNNYALMQREALRHIKGNDLRVYVDLLTYADKVGKCFPGVAKIAKDLGITERNVQKHLANLESEGWIKKNYRKNNSTLYQLYFVDTSNQNISKVKRVSKEVSINDVSVVSNIDRRGVSFYDMPGMSKSDVQTDQRTDHYNRPQEQSVTVSVVSPELPSEKKYKLKPEERIKFRELWNMYHVEGESMRSAESAYSKYCSFEDKALMNRLHNFITDDSGTYLATQMKDIHEEYEAEKEKIIRDKQKEKQMEEERNIRRLERSKEIQKRHEKSKSL